MTPDKTPEEIATETRVRQRRAMEDLELIRAARISDRAHMKRRRKRFVGFERLVRTRGFWETRLGFIAVNAPFILWMQLFRPAWLVPYLVWMSWLTWLSSELPTGGGRD